VRRAVLARNQPCISGWHAFHNDMQRLRAISASLLIGAVAATSPVRAQSPDPQVSCAAEAKIAFDALARESEDVLGSINVPFRITANDYEAHYSDKVEKCLFLVRKTASVLHSTSRMSYLLDAANRNMYALYVFTDGKLQVCKLMPSVAETSACKDLDEFDAFVADYMRH
jgi:hypothetical protein